MIRALLDAASALPIGQIVVICICSALAALIVNRIAHRYTIEPNGYWRKLIIFALWFLISFCLVLLTFIFDIIFTLGVWL